MSRLAGAPVLLVHGFNVADRGAGTTDRLRPGLERCGAVVEEADTDWKAGIVRDLLRVRWYSPRVAAQILSFLCRSKGRWIGVGHSNGCNILWLAAQLGAPFAVLVLINPALARDARFPVQVRRVVAFKSRDDAPVFWARVLHHLSPLNVTHGRHPWGGAGRYGFAYRDPRIREVEESDVVGETGIGHSDVFAPEFFPDFEPRFLTETARAWADARGP